MAITQTDIHASIREYILETYTYDAEFAQRLTDDLLLIDEGILDSYAIHEVLFFLEERFAIEILDEEVIPDNFGSIGAMVSFVEYKLANQ